MARSILKCALLSLVALGAYAQEELAFTYNHTTILYQTPAAGTVSIHFNIVEHGWTKVPQPMQPLTVESLAKYPTVDPELLKGFKQEDGWYQYEVTTPHDWTGPSSEYLEFAFVSETEDGVATWDNNHHQNYKVTFDRLWAVSNLHLQNPTLVQRRSQGIRVYYYSNTVYQYKRGCWQFPTFVHFREGDASEWKTEQMDLAPKDCGYFWGGPITWSYWSFSGGFDWYFFDFKSTKVELVFHNGRGLWDNNNGNNYQIDTPGAWAFAPNFPKNVV